MAKALSRKPAHRYHHGDLRLALVDVAVRIIQRDGVEALTLRSAGQQLGVSRTALYRHFADKQALLAAVAAEGFRMLRLATHDAWAQQGGGREAFVAMGAAYLRLARTHPSHYRVMFGRFLERHDEDAALVFEGTGAFNVLVNALVSLQRDGLARQDDPVVMARFVWATVHGVALLGIDGQIGQDEEEIATLNRYAGERLWASIEMPSRSAAQRPKARPG